MKYRTPRWIALEILQKLESERSNSAILLNEALARIEDSRDRHLITELVLGTLRWKSKLLFYVDHFSRRPRKQLDPKVLTILQLGIYQLLFTDIPQHAAIYETVALCRRARLTSAASFVNGLLRAVQGKLASLPEPPNPGDRWAHPEWLADRWRQQFGEAESVELMQTNNRPSIVYIRMNTLAESVETTRRALASENIEIQPTKWSDQLYSVVSGAPQLSVAFAEGHFYIQDAGVEVLGDMFEAKAGERILEVAAAPGGKTFQLAVRTNDEARIVSLDTGFQRIRSWKRNIERLKIHSAVPVIADARQLPVNQEFDLIVVDAPCSSLGVIRRHPEIKWWRKEDDLVHLSTTQLQILRACAKYVRAGGRLVYSVCSFEPEETSRVTEQFVSSERGFEIRQQRFLYPHRDQTDGFYAVSFHRKDTE